MATRSQQLRKGIKQGLDMEDTRRKREEQANGLRKNKREESLQKRRNFGAESGSSSPVITSLHPHASSSSTLNPLAAEINRLPDLVAGLASDDPVYVLDCTTKIRKLLSAKKDPPIEAVIQAGAIPRLVHLLTVSNQPQIQFEACWALTNIASGTMEQTMAVVHANAIPLFCQLLEVPAADIREQALWALANISGENAALRDLVLSHNAVELTIMQFNANPSPSMIRNATWAISNYCRGAPTTHAIACRLLPVLCHLIKNSDEQVAADASWAVNYLSEDGAAAAIQRIVECPNLIQTLVNNLLHPVPPVITPTLRALGNVVTGNEEQTQAAINAGLCSALTQHLKSKKKTIRKETCWAFSNITAGTGAQIQALLETPAALKQLIDMFNKDESEVRKECCWLFANITCGGSPKQIREVVRAGLIEPLCNQLGVSMNNDPKMTILVLQAFQNILKVGEKDCKASFEATAAGYGNPYAAKIEEYGGLDFIEQLQSHSDNEVYKHAVALLESYFAAEEDDGENVNPNAEYYDAEQDKKLAVTPQAFNFGLPAQPNAFGVSNMAFSF